MEEQILTPPEHYYTAVQTIDSTKLSWGMVLCYVLAWCFKPLLIIASKILKKPINVGIWRNNKFWTFMSCNPKYTTDLHKGENN